MSTTRGKSAWYPIIDPRFEGPGGAAIASALLGLAASGWTEAPAIDLDDPLVSSILVDHRVLALVPSSSVKPAQVEDLRVRKAELSAGQLRLEAVAVESLKLLDAAGVESLVLKGLASAELDYPNPSLRQTGDVDLLIRPEALGAARDALAQRGYTEFETEETVREKGLVMMSPKGLEVDLHTRLFKRDLDGPFDFFRDPVKLTNLPGFALSDELRLVHAAAHFMIAPPGWRRMSGLVDVTMMRRRELDFARVRSVAQDLGVQAHVATVLTMEAVLTDRGDAHRFEQWEQFDWLDRTTLLTTDRRLALEHVARMRERRGINRLRYLRTWLNPNAEQRDKFARSVRRRVSSWQESVVGNGQALPATIRVEESRVIKRGPATALAVEHAKIVAAAQVAEASSLFVVPQVLDTVDETAAGTLKMTRLQDFTSLRGIAGETEEELAWFRDAGSALRQIHRELELAPEYRVALPSELHVDGPEVWIHGDYTKANIGRCRVDGDDCLAVVDWQMTSIYGGAATVGTPFFDVAWFVSGLFMERPDRHLGSWNLAAKADAFIDGYRQRADSSAPPLRGFRSYLDLLYDVRRAELRRGSTYRRLGLGIGMLQWKKWIDQQEDLL